MITYTNKAHAYGYILAVSTSGQMSCVHAYAHACAPNEDRA